MHFTRVQGIADRLTRASILGLLTHGQMALLIYRILESDAPRCAINKNPVPFKTNIFLEKLDLAASYG